jgi:NAD(P)-dependent dehydrogenase (short-subunit alcohol dehydrogenase family)
MSSYLVTGATGFIGRHVMRALLARGGVCHVVVREASRHSLERLLGELGAAADRTHVLVGDVTQPDLGLARGQVAALRGGVDHFFHLAALCDWHTDEATTRAVNVEGTGHAIDLARALGVKTCFHFLSSTAVAGRYVGRFYEHMLEEGQPPDHPYAASRRRAEALVRAIRDLPVRIYRPGIVIGDSRTGVMDEIDGPYHFFPLIRELRDLLPQWVPLVGLEGGILPIVPVDFVAAAIDHLAHAPGLDGKTFHLVDPRAPTAGKAFNVLCAAARAPGFALRLGLPDLGSLLPGLMRDRLPDAARLLPGGLLAELGIPPEVLASINARTVFDTSEAEAALAGSGITCPPLESYAARIWQYWEDHLDPQAHRPAARHGRHRRLDGQRVVITGASSGIGREVARQVAALGGRPLLLARRRQALAELATEIRQAGGDCQDYPIDLTDLEACDRVVERILAEHGQVDVLVNNAGHSIRRALELSLHRFHDFQRTMQLNYFAAVRLILGVLPGMRARRDGHIVNVSTAGLQFGAPRFAAYVASKAALDAFSRTLATEVMGDGICVTTVYMGLVRTPMIEASTVYRDVPAMSPVRAARSVVNALLTRPATVSSPFGTLAVILHALVPEVSDRVLNMLYRISPDRGAPGEGPRETPRAGKSTRHDG